MAQDDIIAVLRKRRASDLPGYGKPSVISEALRGFAGKQPGFSVMDSQAQKMSDAYGLGEQASVASQLYGSVLPFAAASAMANALRAGNLMSPLTVYHGSPHRFSKFDASKINTGEGAQAYGHGLYFAEDPKVAEFYRNKLVPTVGKSKPAYLLDGKIIKQDSTPFADAVRMLANQDGDEKKAIWSAQTVGEILKQSPEHITSVINEINKIKKSGLKTSFKETGGALYTVDIPDEKIAQMLDWDKPIKNQPEVLNIIKSQINDADIAKSFDFNVEKGISGANAMKNYVQGKTQADQSAVLQKLGVPGIRYLDQGSRTIKGGTSNFVVFPGVEKDLRIMKINGRPFVEQAANARKRFDDGQ